MSDDQKFDGEPKKQSLTDEDIVSERAEASEDPSRRSMLLKVAQAAGAIAIIGVTPGCHRIHRGYGYATGITDSDGGPYADPVNHGRGQRRAMVTGITDSDGGPYADPAGQGRGRQGYVSGVTDSDGGPYADPAGNGRGTYRASGYTGLTDSDGGAYADPAGQGRGRWR
jgi:hypothetical protein